MFGILQSAFYWIVPLVLVLSLVVVIHELGHFWAARSFGIAVDRFSIGFGRSIMAWTDKSGVEWRVGWIPLGGYVRFSGDDNVASVPDQDDLETLRHAIVAREGAGAVQKYFAFKPVWQRAIVAAAGPLANFALAIVLFALLAMAFGRPSYPAKIGEVYPGQPAAVAGLRAGDVITKLDNRTVKGFEDVAPYVSIRANMPIRVQVLRGSDLVEVTATPLQVQRIDKFSGKTKVGQLGIRQTPGLEWTYLRYNPLQALDYGARQTWEILSTTVFYLGRLVTGQVPADQLGSILGIADTAGKVAKAGVESGNTVPQRTLGFAANLVGMAAVLSVSVGFMNLLPLPVLDGGHLLFYAYEAVARRPLAARVQAVGYRLGLALLVGFMLFATWNDIQRLQLFKFLGGLS